MLGSTTLLHAWMAHAAPSPPTQAACTCHVDDLAARKLFAFCMLTSAYSVHVFTHRTEPKNGNTAHSNKKTVTRGIRLNLIFLIKCKGLQRVYAPAQVTTMSQRCVQVTTVWNAASTSLVLRVQWPEGMLCTLQRSQEARLHHSVLLLSQVVRLWSARRHARCIEPHPLQGTSLHTCIKNPIAAF
jgi:hypothetical protein